MPNGKCVFSKSWLVKEEYADWVREDKTNKHACFCSLCKNTITQSIALRRKAKDKKASVEDLEKEISKEMEQLKDSL